MVDAAQLRAFVTVSRERNLSRAAEALRLTPSPLSRRIQSLERELERELFERAYHEMVPTPAGAELLPDAVDLLERLADLEATTPRPLRIGITAWAPARLTERLFAAIEESGWPPVTIDEKNTSNPLLHGLAHGQLDIVLAHLPYEAPGISSRAVGRYQLLARSVEPLTSRPHITLGELVDREVLVMPLVMQPAMISALRRTLEDAGVRRLHYLDVADLPTIGRRIRMTGEVLLGTGAQDSPLVEALNRAELHSVPISDPNLRMEIGFVWRTRDDRSAPWAARLHQALGTDSPVPELIIT